MLSSESKADGASSPDLKVGASAPQESEATISEQGILNIRAHEAESGNMLGQVTLDAQGAWILLQWLYSHTDMLHQLTHQDEDVTTKLRADDQQGEPLARSNPR